MNQLVKGHIIFDHDGTLAKVDRLGISLFPGMLELLTDLKNKHFEIYIWTARGRRSTIQSIQQNQLGELLTDISCGDDGMMKPHPMGLLKMLDGIDRKKIIHIGDSPSDLEGAKNFGIDFIFAGWNDQNLGEEFKKITPMVALNLEELKKLIEIKFS